MHKDNGVGQEKRIATESKSALDEILREGARRMLQAAIEAEVADYVEQHADLSDQATGRRLVVRNGNQPERTIQSSLGDIPVSRPRVHDRRDGERFTSSILPPYMRRTPALEALIPLLYLKGISTNDFPDALAAILGENAAGLSPSTISRLKEVWQGEHEQWANRDLSGKRYVYWWADGIYFKVRLTPERPCLLVIVGTLQDGTELTGSGGGTGKVSGIYRMLGAQQSKLSSASAGDTVALGKLEEAATGDTLVAEKAAPKRLADLDFAGRPAFVFDDQVELVTARDPAVEVDFGSERAQILLDRAGRRAGGTRGAIEARPDHAADAQRSRIDRNRARIEHEASALTFDRELQIEPRAERQRLERALGIGRGAPAKRDIDVGARLDLGQRHFGGDERRNQVRFRRANSGALEQAFEAVAARERGLEIEPWPLRRGLERDDRRGGAHPTAAVSAERQRHDHLAAEFVADRIVDHHQRRGFDKF